MSTCNRLDLQTLVFQPVTLSQSQSGNNPARLWATEKVGRFLRFGSSPAEGGDSPALHPWSALCLNQGLGRGRARLNEDVI
jgi:hypothetical protein